MESFFSVESLAAVLLSVLLLHEMKTMEQATKKKYTIFFIYSDFVWATKINLRGLEIAFQIIIRYPNPEGFIEPLTANG